MSMGVCCFVTINRSQTGSRLLPVALKRSDMIQKSVVDQQRKQIQEQNKTIDVGSWLILIEEWRISGFCLSVCERHNCKKKPTNW